MQKTAIVTGAYGNLGQAIVKKFIAEGFAVHGTIMPGEKIPEGFPSTGFTGHTIDLTSEADAGRFIDSVVASNGTVDAAILTVGGFAMGSVAETPLADIQKQYKLNFETTYNIARPVFLQMMKQQSGRIFMTGARPGLHASFSKGMTAYGLAKSLVIRLAEMMNEEAKWHDVVTTVIIPSTIDTPQNRKSMPDADFSAWVKPEDIAGAVYFHCTPGAAVLREPVLKLYGNS